MGFVAIRIVEFSIFGLKLMPELASFQGPTINNRDLDLYRLFNIVHKQGGFNRVTNQNGWKAVATRMVLGTTNSSANQVKQAYKKSASSFLSVFVARLIYRHGGFYSWRFPYFITNQSPTSLYIIRRTSFIFYNCEYPYFDRLLVLLFILINVPILTRRIIFFRT